MTDLDARVAALPKRYEDLQKSGMEADTDPKNLIIKALQDKIAKLQKPALHEPVTDDELQNAMNAYCADEISTKHGWKVALESFLQGRAKPAQEEITPSKLKTAFEDGYNSYQTPCCAMNTIEEAWDNSETKDAAIRASKGEKK